MAQRKRHPLDVPTPVAVALADFCRRAGATVDPRTVRDALSMLAPDQDERVLKIAASAPLAKPLGPFAVVDILINDTSAHEAAELELAGEWRDMQLDEVPEEPLAPAVATKSAPAPAPEPKSKRSRKRAETADRVAPRIRRAGAPQPEPDPVPAPKSSPRFAVFQKKNLPKPRGRFTNVDLTKLKTEMLLKPHFKEELEQMIRQHGHRVALRRALEPQYVGKKGEALAVSDVEGALLHHDLRGAIETSERSLVVAAVTESRGELGRAAVILGMKPDELEHITLNCGAAAEVAKIREHHAREALAHGNVRLKLELLDKSKYLADLGVEKRFREALALELSELLDCALPAAKDLDGLVREASRRDALPYDKLKAAVDRTGLSAAYRRKLAP